MPQANPGTLHDWVEDLPARGRYTFSRAEALSATDASPAAVKQTLYRLKKRKAIVSPRRELFVVLPPEYRTVGCPPAAWFIDQLMEHLGRRADLATRQLVIDEEEAVVVRAFFERCAAGESAASIARWANDAGHRTKVHGRQGGTYAPQA